MQPTRTALLCHGEVNLGIPTTQGQQAGNRRHPDLSAHSREPSGHFTPVQALLSSCRSSFPPHSWTRMGPARHSGKARGDSGSCVATCSWCLPLRPACQFNLTVWSNAFHVGCRASPREVLVTMNNILKGLTPYLLLTALGTLVQSVQQSQFSPGALIHASQRELLSTPVT